MVTTSATEIGCTAVLPDAGERIRIFDDEVVIKVTSAETAGAYALVTVSVAPGGGPPLHTHASNETFYVLAGAFAFTQTDARDVSTFRAEAGATFHAPGGVPHRFENISPMRSTLLIVFSADSVDFLREMGAAFPPDATPDMETMLALHAKYGTEFIYGGAGSRPEPPKDGATSEQARALAWRFTQANDALIATVEGCTPEQWRAVCADTGWMVGVQAHHIADNRAMLTGLIQRVANEEPLPAITLATIDAANARHAEAFAHVTQEETVALLRESGATAADAYRHLSNEQLARTAVLRPNAPPMSAAQLIEYLAIGEIERHGAYLRQAITAYAHPLR